jgi:hypothetical protein
MRVSPNLETQARGITAADRSSNTVIEDGLPKMDWEVPKTILQVELQTRAVRKALADYLPGHLAVPVLRHFQGLSALARIAGGLQQQLLDTKAAEAARAERRRRNRRTTTGVGGGPVRPEDVRAMKEKRRVDAIYGMQRELETQLSNERTKIFNKWKRMRPTLRNQGKKSTKRHAVNGGDVLYFPSFVRDSQPQHHHFEQWRERLEEAMETPIDNRHFKHELTTSKTWAAVAASRASWP